MFDRAAYARHAYELDQAEALERPHVVGDGLKPRAEPAGQLDRARGPLVEHGEDAHPQRVAHRLHVAGIVNRGGRCPRQVV
jgi:hypothetical protein